MKKIFSFIFILLSLKNMKAQHFTENVLFDSTLVSGHHFVNNCMQSVQTQIKLDTSLYNYLDGLQFLLILDTVHFNGPVSSIHSGDTILLNSTNPIFTTISSGLTDFWYRLKLVGTPILANQSYPCYIEINVCTCFCLDILIQKSTSNGTICKVDVFNTVKELKKDPISGFYPNPSANKLFIKNHYNITKIQIFNSTGELILENDSNNLNEIDVSKLHEGVYSLVLFKEGDTLCEKVMISDK